jgi:DNA invertase Pin-like site-specific DNA recombinase
MDETGPERAPLARAAQYVRMSTEHQRYSPENQRRAIAEYAARRGYEIVRSYADEGKSGLTVDARFGLLQLIEDVRSGVADYDAILVYDVSRWGRFQDTDESAYYEFLCRRAGLSVIYCAEPFENDGTPLATIIKSIKRAMAGEYSRELSVKIFAAQTRFAEQGYWQGGSPGYGLRRLLTDENGAPKGVLAPGENKSIRSDRVVLKLGPRDEVKTVRRIFRLFVTKGLSEAAIASILNAEGLRNEFGRPWRWHTLNQILTNQKYLGRIIRNRKSTKLKTPAILNPPERWTRTDDAFPAIIAPQLFAEAQSIIAKRRQHHTDHEMLERLRRIWREHGHLSSVLVNAVGTGPTSATYHRRFGSMLHAYRLVGFYGSRYEPSRISQAKRPGIIADIVAGIERVGGRVSRDPKTDILTINGEFTLAIEIARCTPTVAGSPRWLIRFDCGPSSDVRLVARLDAPGEAPRDYFLLPRVDMPSKLLLGDDNPRSLEAYRFENLSFLYAMAARSPVREVA